MAIDGKVRKWLIGIELRGQKLPGSLEMLQVFLGPPVSETALGSRIGCPDRRNYG